MIKTNTSNKSRLDILNNFFKNAVIDEENIEESSIKIKKILNKLEIYSSKEEFKNYFLEKNRDNLIFYICLDPINKNIVIEENSQIIHQKLNNQSLYLISRFCFIKNKKLYENDIDWTNWLISLLHKNITITELKEELSMFIKENIYKIFYNLKLSLFKQGSNINFVSIANNPYLIYFLKDTDLIHIVNNKDKIINKLHPDDVNEDLFIRTFELILKKIKYKMIFINYGLLCHSDIKDNLYNKKSNKLNIKEFLLMEYNNTFNSFFHQNKLNMFEKKSLDNLHFLLFILYGLEKKLFTKEELAFLEESKVLFSIKNNATLAKFMKQKDINNLFKKNNIKLTKNINSIYRDDIVYPKKLITIEYTLECFYTNNEFYKLDELIKLSKAVSIFGKVLCIKHFKSTSYNKFINIKQELIDNAEVFAKINKISKKHFITNVKEKLVFEDQTKLFLQ